MIKYLDIGLELMIDQIRQLVLVDYKGSMVETLGMVNILRISIEIDD